VCEPLGRRVLEEEHYHHRFQSLHGSTNGPLSQNLRLELFEDEKSVSCLLGKDGTINDGFLGEDVALTK